MQGWKNSPANGRWSKDNEGFFWNLGYEAVQDVQVFGGLPAVELTDDQQCSLHKTVSLQHPEDLDFCCESAEIIESMAGKEDDAALIREHSLKRWAPDRAIASANSIHGTVGGYAIDSAFKMVVALLSHYDRNGNAQRAGELARLAAEVLLCEQSKGGAMKRAADMDALRVLFRSAQALCAKYEVSLTSP
jgi:hypothetical protein